MENKFEINYSWLTVDETKDNLFRNTMAFLEMKLNNVNLTEVYNKETDMVHKNIFVSLFPLAQKIVYDWFFIFYEITHKEDVDFKIKHSISSISQGHVYPNIYLFANEDKETITIECDKNSTNHEIFLNGVEIVVDIENVKKEFSKFIEDVINRLNHFKIECEELKKNWEYIKNINTKDLDHCIQAVEQGLNPFEK